MAIPPWTTIGGRYALFGEIASGGMAAVYLARQVGAGGFARIVAVKRLHQHYARDPEFVAMFLDEARIVARIRHPNVVQTVDVVAEAGELFLVMEYVEGDSLLRVLQAARREGASLPVPVIAAIVAGALHGLHEAHEARGETGEALQIVHRDVSPHNILVGVDGVGRVLDFGVASARQRLRTTQDGELKGKLSFMAPEQIRSQPVDRRTDVYAAAVCLWEALAGTKLFHGDSEGAVVEKILHEPVVAPTRMNASLPVALDAVVLRGLAREPGERFATARDMAIALARATPLATIAETGAVVAQVCRKTLAERANLVATIERGASSANLEAAVDSLRSLALGRELAAREPSIAPSSGSVPSSSGPAPREGTQGVVRHAPGASSGYPGGPGPAAPFPPPNSLAPPSGREASGGTRVVVTHDRLPAPRPASTAAALAASAAVVVIVLSLGAYLSARALVSRAARHPSTLSTEYAGGPSVIAVGPSQPAASAVPPPPCPDGMATVAGGRFFMGSDDDLSAERPAHNVTLHAYCLDRLEVTAEDYRACSDRGECKRAGTMNKWDGITGAESKVYDPLCTGPDPARGRHPINCVEWSSAERYCRAAGKRLPTEAEWEYAARGSDGRKYPWGDAAPSVEHLNACGAECVAWGRRNRTPLEALFTGSDAWPTTAPVGSFPRGASVWGIHDLVGNVWEWTADYYAAYSEVDSTDPRGPSTGTTRVMRGGAWNGGYSDWVRPSFRFHASPETRSHGIGFRCAKTL